jgi:phosphoribosylaminoimidazole-succinocarboxamide synthase
MVESKLVYSGKVRDVYEGPGDILVMIATDRISAFDKVIGTVPGKGRLLNQMSEFWFNRTGTIVGNHLIYSIDNRSTVRKCTPFPIEVIVRGYITGSLWAKYSKGDREYCGVTFPDGLKQHQKLPKPVITPTTKGITDEPISREEIIQEGYMNEHECDYIFAKALELFAYGQSLSDKAGLILVDTKYEFGKDRNGRILLIDELHTCDSSRFWIKDSYQNRSESGQNPESLDKDCVRNWVRSVCEPATEDIPEIPQNIIDRAYRAYDDFYSRLIKVQMSEQRLAVIISGSIKDNDHVAKIVAALDQQNIHSALHVSSAHKNTRRVLDLIEKYDNDYLRRVVWVTVAGRSNALSGVIAANSKRPVIACPPFADKMDMMVNIHSTLQCPSNVPVMTILDPGNVALSIKRIFDL